ncbi:MAG: hypothetical protein ACEY3C_02160 [Candidatus Tisiphia sp.]
MSAAVWADRQLESRCQQFLSYQGPSSSQHNASYDTCLDTSDSEEDIALAGNSICVVKLCSIKP